MSYPQTTSHSETTTTANFPARSVSNMYAQPQARTQRDSQGQPINFAQGPATAQTEHNPMGTMMNQFAGLGIPGANMASNPSALGVAQLPQVQYYMTADGQYLVAPTAGMYPTQTLAPTQLPESTYNGYAATLPYFATNSAYSSYVPGYPMMQYASARPTYYSDRSDQLHKEVPGLENRRGSYSTNESAPSTPFYGSVSQREQGTQIMAVDRSPFGSTPSPQQLPAQHAGNQSVKPLLYKTIPINVDLDALLVQHPVIPRAVPAVFTPRENMRTLDQSLSNPLANNTNVYIRGLHPQTDDDTLAAYAARFGKVDTSKAIIDTSTGACKGFGFAKYMNVRDAELCIRGFYKLGYEVGFARESFNSRLKAEGDETSTNLYVSNLPKNMTEAELGAIFMDYTVSSSRILRDPNNSSRGVGFARFETRQICEEIIQKFHGQPIGEEGLLLQVRYADTPAQKDLKRITTERRQFRTNEYNAGAYGTTPEAVILSPPMPSPLVPRASMIARHLPISSRASGSWKREPSINSSVGFAHDFKDVDHQKIKSEPASSKPKDVKVSIPTPTISEDGSADDDMAIHRDALAVAHGSSNTSPTAHKS